VSASISAIELLAILHRCRDEVDAILHESAEPHKRAPRIAQMLHALWPESPLCACLLRYDGGPVLSALDEAGVPRPECAESVRSAIIRYLPLDSDQFPPKDQWPKAIQVEHWLLALEHFSVQNQWAGALALALPSGSSEAHEIAIRSLLAVFSQRLGLGLDLAAHARKLQALDRELTDVAPLANLGELAGPVAHELNNFFYSLLLQLAVLEQSAPESNRHDLEVIRRQGIRASELIRSLQDYRRSSTAATQMIDLNGLIRALVDMLSGGETEKARGQSIRLLSRLSSDLATSVSHAGVLATLSLEPNLPPVVGGFTDLKRLCLFLVSNAAAAAELTRGSIAIHTERLGDKASLRIEDTGTVPSSAVLADLFEPNHLSREGTNSLELAACRTLVRRLQGTISAESIPERGMRISVLLPLQTE
jgi:signal transduction histidine kinase